MIKYEDNMLVLDSSHTRADQDAVNKFISKVQDEAFSKGYEAGVKTATEQHPPIRFRDKGNAE